MININAWNANGLSSTKLLDFGSTMVSLQTDILTSQNKKKAFSKGSKFTVLITLPGKVGRGSRCG